MIRVLPLAHRSDQPRKQIRPSAALPPSRPEDPRRKVVVSEFMSIDGVMEAPYEWQPTFWHDDIGSCKNEELFASDALLLGQVTYEGFASI